MKKMAATNITNLRHALNSEEQIRKRYQDLLMQKYGRVTLMSTKHTQSKWTRLSGWTDTDESVQRLNMNVIK